MCLFHFIADLPSVDIFFGLCHCSYQLSAINPAIINKGCSNLTPGESICLGFVGEDCSTTQVVQPDDTCAGIAATNGLNMTILHLNNPQLDKSCDIYVGEVRLFFFYFPCLLSVSADSGTDQKEKPLLHRFLAYNFITTLILTTSLTGSLHFKDGTGACYSCQRRHCHG